MIILWSVFLMCVVSVVGVADAGWVQYELATGNVTGGPRDTAQEFGTVLDHGVIEDPALNVALPVWPRPVGCIDGQQDWTKLSAGNVLPLIVRPGLFFLTTNSTLFAGCVRVGSWRELRAVYRGVVVGEMASDDGEFLEALDDIQVMASRRCPGVTGGANCDTVRANMSIMDAEYPTTARLATLTTRLVTLRTEVRAFKVARGW